ncbi:hypothetical protein SNEBB_002878, partial [Seison nebaliae]
MNNIHDFPYQDISEIPVEFLPPVTFPDVSNNSQTDMKVKLIPTRRGNEAAIYDNFIYHNRKVYASGKINYSCRKKDCKASLTLYDGNICIILDQHNHDQQLEEIEKMQSLNAVKHTSTTTTMSTTDVILHHSRDITNLSRRNSVFERNVRRYRQNDRCLNIHNSCIKNVDWT